MGGTQEVTINRGGKGITTDCVLYVDRGRLSMLKIEEIKNERLLPSQVVLGSSSQGAVAAGREKVGIGI